jgi:hypothetical protein
MYRDSHPERKSLTYCAHRRGDGKYILLDRDYKPMGWKGDGWADYDAWPSAFSVKITPEMAAKLSHDRSADLEWIWFYNDGCPPWGHPDHRTDYQMRLEMFFDLVDLATVSELAAG